MNIDPQNRVRATQSHHYTPYPQKCDPKICNCWRPTGTDFCYAANLTRTEKNFWRGMEHRWNGGLDAESCLTALYSDAAALGGKLPGAKLRRIEMLENLIDCGQTSLDASNDCEVKRLRIVPPKGSEITAAAARLRADFTAMEFKDGDERPGLEPNKGKRTTLEPERLKKAESLSAGIARSLKKKDRAFLQNCGFTPEQVQEVEAELDAHDLYVDIWQFAYRKIMAGIWKRELEVLVQYQIEDTCTNFYLDRLEMIQAGKYKEEGKLENWLNTGWEYFIWEYCRALPRETQIMESTGDGGLYVDDKQPWTEFSKENPGPFIKPLSRHRPKTGGPSAQERHDDHLKHGHPELGDYVPRDPRNWNERGDNPENDRQVSHERLAALESKLTGKELELFTFMKMFPDDAKAERARCLDYSPRHHGRLLASIRNTARGNA